MMTVTAEPPSRISRPHRQHKFPCRGRAIVCAAEVDVTERALHHRRSGNMQTQDRKMPDAQGWRCKLGVMAPSTNTIVQPDFDDMRPIGVTNHYSRIFTPN